MKLEFSRKSFEKYLNITFHENASRGSRVVPCGRTDGQTDMAKLTVAFRNFANASKNGRTETHVHELLKAHVPCKKHARSEASTTLRSYDCSINGFYPNIRGYFPSQQRCYNQYVHLQLLMINRY
jgi:hypothetical protein